MITAKKISDIQETLRSLITDLEDLKRSIPDYKEVKFDEKQHNVVDMLKCLSEGLK